MSNLTFVVPAAGEGKRMQSAFPGTPKALIPLCGQPMINHVLDAVIATRFDLSIVVVVSPGVQQTFEKILGKRKVSFAVQSAPLGTADAVRAARPAVSNSATTIAIAFADQPIMSTPSIVRLVTTHFESNATVTMAVVKLRDFLGMRAMFSDWGRIVRDRSGAIAGIVEARDATPAQLALTEVNPSLYCFKAPWVWDALADLSADNVQREYLLTAVIPIAIREGLCVESINIVNPIETMGANSPEQLKTLEKVYRQAERKRRAQLGT